MNIPGLLNPSVQQRNTDRRLVLTRGDQVGVSRVGQVVSGKQHWPGELVHTSLCPWARTGQDGGLGVGEFSDAVPSDILSVSLRLKQSRCQ